MGGQWNRFCRGGWVNLFQRGPAEIFQAQQLLIFCETGIFALIQLNMYNFHKIRENNAESYFHHHSFDRSNEQKLADIHRKPEKKKRKNEDSEDDGQN